MISDLLERQGYLIARRRESSLAWLASRMQWVTYDIKEQKSAVASITDLSDVMTWGPYVISGTTLAQLDQCLLDLHPVAQAMCVLNWTVLAFNFEGIGVLAEWDVISLSRTIDNAIFERRRSVFEEAEILRHRRLLIDFCLLRRGAGGGDPEVFIGIATLAILRHLLPIGPPVDPDILMKYAEALDIMHSLVVPVSPLFSATDDVLRILVRCYLDLWTKLEWRPTGNGTNGTYKHVFISMYTCSLIGLR